MEITARLRIISAILFLLTVLPRKHNFAKAAVSSCNGVLKGDSGTFTSPNYPLPPKSIPKDQNSPLFPDNGGFVTCQWEVIVSTGKGIQLKFGDFDMNAAMDECDEGEVEVYSGVGKKKSSLDKYCGGNNPDTVMLTNNTATVVFKRPAGFDGRGFLISYMATKPGVTIDDFVNCSDTGKDHSKVGSFSVMCPSGCVGINKHKIIGDLKYREDSQICLAAVHAGVISDNFGGRVNVLRQPGLLLYHGEYANNIEADTGSMSDSMFTFKQLSVCHDQIKVYGNQYTASSWWDTVNHITNLEQHWLPSKALFTNDIEAWSPDDPLTEQWLQLDLKRPMNITGVVTMGSLKPYKWTKSYTISHSLDRENWQSYIEEGETKPTVFNGNKNYFNPVRNNFIRPAIVAQYVRIYPTPVQKVAFRYGLKFALLGCDLSDDVPFLPPVIPPSPSRKSTTTTTTTTTKKSTTTTTTTTTPTSTTLPSTTTATTTQLTSPRGNTTEPATFPKKIDSSVKTTMPLTPPKTENLNETSIIIIAIVAALSVTSILLAALVLILVRKRKKSPKNTLVPTSQANATYNTAVDMRYLNGYQKGADGTKKDRKKSPAHYDFKNDNYKDSYIRASGSDEFGTMANSRGGVTLLHDQLTQSTKGHVRGSYTANNDQTGPSSGPLLTKSRSQHDSESYTTDDEDHEYQVIPDPVSDYDVTRTHSNRNSSKASTVSSHKSRQSDTMPWPQNGNAIWGNAGDAWGKEQQFPTQNGMSSFAPTNSNRSHPVNRTRPGTYPHPLHYSDNDNFMPQQFEPPKTAPPFSNSFTPNGKFPHRSRGGSKSPPHGGPPTNGPPHFVPHNPHQRSSSSSTGSSHSPFDSVLYDQQHYPAVPEYEDQVILQQGNHDRSRIGSQKTNLLYGDPESSKSWPNSDNKRKPSYKFPNNQLAEPTLPPKLTQGNGVGNGGRSPEYGSDPGITRVNGGMSLRHSNSRTDKKNRNGYDHLYRNKSIGVADNGKAVIAMTMNNYNQLDLNTPV